MPPTINLNGTLGALEIGVLISLFLFGIVTVQTSVYYDRFHKDPWHVKFLVAFVWVLELGHTLLISYLVYSTTITWYGQPEKLVRFESLNATVIFGAIITLTVQVFFAYRVWKIMNHSSIGVFCWFLSFSRFVGSIVAGAQAFKSPSIMQFAVDWRWLLTTVLVTSACVDVIIAMALCYFLLKHRDNTFDSFHLIRTTRVLDRLVAWTLQTGLMTSVTAVAMVICLQTMPLNFVWISIYTCLGKLYSNSLLASLNSRIKLRDAGTRMNVVDPSFFRSDQSIPPSPRPVPIISVEVTRTIDVDGLESPRTEKSSVYDTEELTDDQSEV
jgi:hypothetical protein